MIILVGYNGSDPCKNALAMAKQHAAVLQGRIEVVQAISRKESLSYERIQKRRAAAGKAGEAASRRTTGLLRNDVAGQHAESGRTNREFRSNDTRR